MLSLTEFDLCNFSLKMSLSLRPEELNPVILGRVRHIENHSDVVPNVVLGGLLRVMNAAVV